MAAYFCEGSEAMIELEKMIDTAGLRNVLWAIDHICREKADHIRSNYGPKDADAAQWVRDARKVQRVIDAIKVS